MPRYRIDFLFVESHRLAMREIDYESDQAAIIGAHAINGVPTIGSGFRIWREDRLIHWHPNEPQSSTSPVRASRL